MKYLQMNEENINQEHICCAISDKKCAEGYELKKQWLKNGMKDGYVFERLDARAKVFIEFGPAEKAWLPIQAPNYLALGCFWVSGQYKGKGYGKVLLGKAMQAAREQKKAGLVTVVGKKKYHFMSDTKWLLQQGFEICDETPAGFLLVALRLDQKTTLPIFKPAAKKGESPDKKGYVVYYSHRCPYTEYHIRTSLEESARKRNLKIKNIKLSSMKEAQNSPTPATIFSLFYDGKFVTTDLSVCMDSRFDRIVNK